jgi:hypothetical protein
MKSEALEKCPYEIAEIIFREPPSEPNNFQLYCEMENDDVTTQLDIFEIFMTIVMEGMFIKNNISRETLDFFNEQTILDLQPYFHSLGYHTNVEVIPIKNTEAYETFYCRIALRCDPSWEAYFDMHPEITQNYRFIFGGNSPKIQGEKCTFNNLFAIFSHKNLVYKISFNCI